MYSWFYVILKNVNVITSDGNFVDWFLNCVSLRASTHLQTLHINSLETSLVPVCGLLVVCLQTVHKQMFHISCLLLEMENRIQFANTSSIPCALHLRQMLRTFWSLLKIYIHSPVCGISKQQSTKTVTRKVMHTTLWLKTTLSVQWR